MLFLQAHPFRRDLTVANWEYLDGYEVFNGNPRHKSCNEIAEMWAKYHNKNIVVAGSDFHEKGDEGIGGVYFEKEINQEALNLKQSPYLFLSLIREESHFNKNAKSFG